MKNYYEILEVSENASNEVIEKAYKTLAKKYHPDMQHSNNLRFAENKFKELTEAYETLSNPALRKQYDNKLGLISNNDNLYTNLYSEQEKLKNEVNNLKIEQKSQEYINKKRQQISNNTLNPKKYIQAIGSALYEETKKSKEERSKDLFAVILTLIIVGILFFVFWKIPAVKNYLFP